MKKFILLTLFIALTLSFVLKDRLNQIKKDVELNSENGLLTACSNNQTNALYSGIAGCEMVSESNTVDCVMNSIQGRINERWNVFARRSSSFAGVAFWIYNNCSVVLSNYGTYNRTYTAWPSALYNNTQLGDSNCTYTRNTTVANAISGCEMPDETNTARCIINQIKTSVNEYWNAYVASTYAQSAVRYWFYDNCTITFQNYGRYNRTYIAWKAY